MSNIDSVSLLNKTMEISVPIRGINYDFPLWTNKLQKHILLSISKESSVKDNVDSIFPLINKYSELNNLHYIDKLYILLKSREYSVGPTVEDIIICKACQHPVSETYSINNNLKYNTYPNNIDTIDGVITFDNDGIPLLNNVRMDSDDMPAENYIKLKDYTKQYNISLYIEYKNICTCGNTNHVIHDEKDILFDIISSIEVSELYKYYANITYNYKLSIVDIDNMYVFERGIYENLYKTLDKQDSNEQ